MTQTARTSLPGIAAALIAQAESAERDRDLPAARDAYAAVLAQLPRHVGAHRGLARIEFLLGHAVEGENLQRAADALEVAERLALARNLIDTPLEAKALALAQKLAGDFPQLADAQYGYAQHLRRAGRLDEAVAALRRTLAADAGHAPSLALLAALEEKSRIGEGLRPAPFRLLPGFLDAAQHQRLLDYALANEAAMVPSWVESATPKPEWRRSRIVPADATVLSWFAPLIAARAEALLADFGYGAVRVDSIGLDWVASNDGDFYRHHVDTGPGHYALRTISFVYYFNRQPKGFSGGELGLYDTDLATGEFDPAGRTTLEPLDNRLVLFPSAARHEILPVRCPSRAFADSRFTLNGWIRRAP